MGSQVPNVSKFQPSTPLLAHSIYTPRFRPNIVIHGAGIPWAEDMWETIKIGENDSTISLVSKCTRCLVRYVCSAHVFVS